MQTIQKKGAMFRMPSCVRYRRHFSFRPYPKDECLVRIFPFAFVSGSKQQRREQNKKKSATRAHGFAGADITRPFQRRYVERIKNDLWQQSFCAPGSFKALSRSLIIFVRAITRLMRGISKEFPGNPPPPHRALFKAVAVFSDRAGK